MDNLLNKISAWNMLICKSWLQRVWNLRSKFTNMSLCHKRKRNKKLSKCWDLKMIKSSKPLKTLWMVLGFNWQDRRSKFSIQWLTYLGPRKQLTIPISSKLIFQKAGRNYWNVGLRTCQCISHQCDHQIYVNKLRYYLSRRFYWQANHKEEFGAKNHFISYISLNRESVFSNSKCECINSLCILSIISLGRKII